VLAVNLVVIFLYATQFENLEKSNKRRRNTWKKDGRREGHAHMASFLRVYLYINSLLFVHKVHKKPKDKFITAVAVGW